MRLLIVNPNTTASMTAKIAAAARLAASTKSEIVAVNPAHGPASIEGYYDEAMSLAGLLGVIRDNSDFDAVVIACFDDTGLDAARCLTDKPVVGIGEAAYHMASMIANRFSVVTTLARSVPALEHNLHRYGLWARCARVRSSEVAVLELEEPGSDASSRISAEIARAIAEDRAEAIVLGCAGMTDLAGRLSAEHGVPVLDGVSCAVALCESMVRLGLRTSRLGGYAPVPPHKLG
ncbi:aspartate/glutamate racemase family protein [uncultured Paracoccus sp.]|uniref:aspartate/glutamate racemase family protein n=1 Tax=uncultured Paracoccus sp. TaxID=189685 RepID=UPI0025D8768F|nr:aspartate/glutamate racemase family protein [uncultured Paracoccus sp.]